MFDYDSSSTGSTWGSDFEYSPPRKYARPNPRRADVSVLPGEGATADALQNAAMRKRMLALIRRFRSEGALSASSCDAAEVFLEALPRPAALPLISPDDGSLLMVWERDGDRTLVSIEGWTIHAVAHAGTPQANYFDAVEFDGSDIPQDIKNIIAPG